MKECELNHFRARSKIREWPTKPKRHRADRALEHLIKQVSRPIFRRCQQTQDALQQLFRVFMLMLLHKENTENHTGTNGTAQSLARFGRPLHTYIFFFAVLTCFAKHWRYLTAHEDEKEALETEVEKEINIQ